MYVWIAHVCEEIWLHSINTGDLRSSHSSFQWTRCCARKQTCIDVCVFSHDLFNSLYDESIPQVGTWPSGRQSVVYFQNCAGFSGLLLSECNGWISRWLIQCYLLTWLFFSEFPSFFYALCATLLCTLRLSCCMVCESALLQGIFLSTVVGLNGLSFVHWM